MHNPNYPAPYHETFSETLDRLSLEIERAKALTAIGASADMEDYRREILNNYFDSVLFHLTEASVMCNQLSQYSWSEIT